MKKTIFFVIAFAFLSTGFFNKSQAQVLDGIYVKEHVPARKPVPYNYLREADLMWTKRIWRIIDMQQKINHPLYYPTGVPDQGARMSFINLVLRAWRGDFADINHPRLTLYAYDMTTDDFSVLVEATDQEVIGKINKDALDSAAVGSPSAPVSSMIDWDLVFQSTFQVKKLMLKEDWYFDKQRAKLEVRIVGICPIIEQIQYDPNTGEEIGKRPFPCFWIYFLEARQIFANHEVFNPYNDAERRTFDDIFFYRKFDSYITQETNVFNDRPISSFKYGLDALLESERIKDWMFKVEHDLWEY